MPPQHVLSRAAFERLQAELEDLTTRGRVEIAQAIERARELGDLSENGDYQAAKEQQGMMEGRIRHLQSMLKGAVIAESADGDSVQTGCIVVLRYEGDDDDERYLIGHIEEKRPGLDVISPGSPLGTALIGATPGSTVEYDAPNGKLRVEVRAVEPA